MKLLSLGLVGLLVACGGSSSDNSSTTQHLDNYDQSGIDVQTLQVWTPGRVFPTQTPGGWFSPTDQDAKLDAARCPQVSSTSFNGTETTATVDCTDAFAQAKPFDVDGKTGPTMDPVDFTFEVQNGQFTYPDPDYCKRIELRIVARDAATSQPSFAGIGFFTSKGDTFTPKERLQAVGHTTLKNGDPATVYRFSGISTCISSQDSTSGNEFQTFFFKPYAGYRVDVNLEEGPLYRVWEAINGNFGLGKSWPGAVPVVNSDGFDRQADLLAH
jgi:hypothetical protein